MKFNKIFPPELLLLFILGITLFIAINSYLRIDNFKNDCIAQNGIPFSTLSSLLTVTICLKKQCVIEILGE